MTENARLAEWKQTCRDVAGAMQARVVRYVTPISHALSHDEGQHQGSGSYIDFAGRRLLITNEHVIPRSQGGQFTHQFRDCEDVFRLNPSIAAEPYPVDIAVCEIPDQVWAYRAHTSAAIPATSFAAKHDPVERELLFLIGYPEEGSRFLFGTLFSRAFPLLTQQPIPEVSGLHANELAIAYKSEGAERIDGSSRPAPVPHGMSGSLLWNTRTVECMAKGVPWSPNAAQVTGVTCRWSSSDLSIFAVRVEVILDFLHRNIERA